MFTGLLFKLLHRVLDQDFRSSLSDVFLGKGALKICSKFAGEHPCRSVISIKLQSNQLMIYTKGKNLITVLAKALHQRFLASSKIHLRLDLCMKNFCLLAEI